MLFDMDVKICGSDFRRNRPNQLLAVLVSEGTSPCTVAKFIGLAILINIIMVIQSYLSCQRLFIAIFKRVKMFYSQITPFKIIWLWVPFRK